MDVIRPFHSPQWHAPMSGNWFYSCYSRWLIWIITWVAAWTHETWRLLARLLITTNILETWTLLWRCVDIPRGRRLQRNITSAKTSAWSRWCNETLRISLDNTLRRQERTQTHQWSWQMRQRRWQTTMREKNPDLSVPICVTSLLMGHADIMMPTMITPEVVWTHHTPYEHITDGVRTLYGMWSATQTHCAPTMLVVCMSPSDCKSATSDGSN